MKHDREAAEVIELGKVSDETLGLGAAPGDEIGGDQRSGLSTD